MTAKRIEKALKGVQEKSLRDAVAKDVMIAIRATKADKQHMQRAAKELNLTLTEYLTTCHRLVAGHLKLK